MNSLLENRKIRNFKQSLDLIIVLKKLSKKVTVIKKLNLTLPFLKKRVIIIGNIEDKNQEIISALNFKSWAEDSENIQNLSGILVESNIIVSFLRNNNKLLTTLKIKPQILKDNYKEQLHSLSQSQDFKLNGNCLQVKICNENEIEKFNELSSLYINSIKESLPAGYEIKKVLAKTTMGHIIKYNEIRN